jgi:Glycosyltransferase
MLRILHCVVNMNRGGAESLLMNIYRNIDRRKIQFDFLTSREGVFDKEIKDLGGRIYRIPYITDSGHFSYIKSLRKFFAEHNEYSIVHSHMDKVSGLVLQQAYKQSVKYRIAHSHNTRSSGGWLTRIYKSYAGSLLRHYATHYFACSNSAANWLFGNRNSQNVLIINNGVDFETFMYSPETRKKIREQLNIDQDTLVIGHVGRFDPVKNQSFLVDIFNQITKLRENSVLILVGGGGNANQITEKISNLGIKDKVKMLGVRDDIPHLLQAFDLFIFPSLYEGLPLALIEAQVSGLPCIISDRITNEVDISGQVTFLPVTKSPENWAIKALEIYDSNYDRSNIVESKLDVNYDIKKTVEVLENFYMNLVN